MPIGKAYELCPRATFIRPDFSKYKPASQEVMAVLERYGDPIDTEGDGPSAMLEVVGLDEAYLDVTARTGGDWQRAHALARSLQAAVRRETGLGCSVGVAASKAVAKIASDHRKPHGVTVVSDEDRERFLDPLPVRLINGCGPKTAARLVEWGIETIGDLARTEPALLEERFGSHGPWLWRIANGRDDRPVTPLRGPSKSRGNERTYGRDEQEPERVRASLRRLLDGLLASKDRRAFSTLTVKVRYSDFSTVTRAHTLSVPIDPSDADAAGLAWATVDSLATPLLDGRAVRLAGVRLSGFSSPTGQRSLRAYGFRGAMRPKLPKVTMQGVPSKRSSSSGPATRPWQVPSSTRSTPQHVKRLPQTD